MDNVIGRNIQYELVYDGDDRYNPERELARMIDKVRRYYDNKNLTIIGLNDSQGVDTSLLYRKDILECLRDLLISGEQKATCINAFSSLFNKTEHVDYFLKANLSLAEIKELQVQSIVDEMNKYFHNELHIPKIFHLGNIGYVSRNLYKIGKEDKNICLTDSLINTKEPIVIYSCGTNDLIRESGCNPFNIINAHLNGQLDKIDDFVLKYALCKLENPNTIKGVVSNVERNFNHILGINPNADICALGICLPDTFQRASTEIFLHNHMNVQNVIKKFIEVTESYNEQLYNICNKYKIAYVLPNSSARFGLQKCNFHAAYEIQKERARQIIVALYWKLRDKERFDINQTSLPRTNQNTEEQGLNSMLTFLEQDLEKAKKEEIEHFKNIGVWDNTSDKSMDFREYIIASLKQEKIENQMKIIKKANAKIKRR